MLLLDAVIDTEGVSKGLTAMLKPLEVTAEVVIQASEEFKIHVTSSPSLRLVVENWALLEPAFEPLICHWKSGLLPPFIAVAVKLTAEPWQILLFEAVIETEGVIEELTVRLKLFDTAGLPEIQGLGRNQIAVDNICRFECIQT